MVLSSIYTYIQFFLNKMRKLAHQDSCCWHLYEYTRIEMLTKDKYSSLLGPFVGATTLSITILRITTFSTMTLSITL
jgi:hypothetical protein